VKSELPKSNEPLRGFAPKLGYSKPALFAPIPSRQKQTPLQLKMSIYFGDVMFWSAKVAFDL
jgi:hypothetical protein